MHAALPVFGQRSMKKTGRRTKDKLEVLQRQDVLQNTFCRCNDRVSKIFDSGVSIIISEMHKSNLP